MTAEHDDKPEPRDLTRGWVPVTAIGVLISGAVTCTAIVVGFQRDTQRDIANLRAEMFVKQTSMVNRIDAIHDLASQHITETAFDNWRLRLYIANKSTNLEVPEYKR